MILFDNKIYQEDLRRTLDIQGLETFKGKTFLITGASGLIGSALVDHLLYLNIYQDFQIVMYLAGRSEVALRKRFGYFMDREDVCFVEYDATLSVQFDMMIDYVVHAASNATPRCYVEDSIATMVANFEGMHRLLDYACKNKAQGVLYISSSEVYGVVDHNQPLKEEDYGYIDHLNVRASYPMSKRATETLCIAYAQQYGLKVNILRPGYIYGPSAKPTDTRVSSAFFYEVLKGHPIVMKSAGQQVRSYCHVLDCSAAILTVLLSSNTGQVYNVSNKNSILSIREFSEILAQEAGASLNFDLPTEQEKKEANPMRRAVLDSTRLEALGWRGRIGVQEGIIHTLSQLKESIG